MEISTRMDTFARHFCYAETTIEWGDDPTWGDNRKQVTLTLLANLKHWAIEVSVQRNVAYEVKLRLLCFGFAIWFDPNN